MAPIPLTFVVSFTSQDDQHPAQNLLLADSFGSNHWQCGNDNTNDSVEVELQFLQRFKISYIDIGNYGSATIQILVGLSSWAKNHEFRCLLPTSVLMSPENCKTMTKAKSIRMFTDEHLVSEVKEQEWDRVRIRCSQPYRRGVPFGLSFVRFFTDDDPFENSFDKLKVEQNGDDSKTSVAWERLKGLKSEFEPESPTFMSRSARAVMAATNSNSSLVTTIKQLEEQTLNSSQREEEKPETEVEITNKRKIKTTPLRNGISPKKRKISPENDATPIPIDFSSPPQCTSSSSTFTDEIMVNCPICTAEFPETAIDLHVNMCLDSTKKDPLAPPELESQRELTSAPSCEPPAETCEPPQRAIDDEAELSQISWVSCPICEHEYEGWFISSHVNSCVDRRETKRNLLT